MNLKQFLPYENYTLTTSFSPMEVQERFRTNIEPMKDYRFLLFNKMPKRIYEGKIDGAGFIINRILRASRFKILIWGEISTVNDQTQIKIKMEYELHVKFLSILILGIFGIVSIFVLIIGINNGLSLEYLGGFVPLLFVYLFLMLPFKDESNDAKKFLERLFEGKEINNEINMK